MSRILATLRHRPWNFMRPYPVTCLLLIFLTSCGSRSDGVLLRTEQMEIEDRRGESFPTTKICAIHAIPLAETLVGFQIGLHFPDPLHEERKKRYFPYAITSLPGACSPPALERHALVRTCLFCDHLDRLYAERRVVYGVTGKGDRATLAGVVYDDRVDPRVDMPEGGDADNAGDRAAGVILGPLAYTDADIEAVVDDLTQRASSVTFILSPVVVASGAVPGVNLHEQQMNLKDILHHLEVHCGVPIILQSRDQPDAGGLLVFIGY